MEVGEHVWNKPLGQEMLGSLQEKVRQHSAVVNYQH